MEMECDLLVSSFNNPKTTALMKKNLGHVSDGSSPHCAGALKLGFKKAFDEKQVFDARKQETTVLLRCSNNKCGWSRTPALYSSVGSHGACPQCAFGGFGYHMLCTGCGHKRTGAYTSCHGCRKRFA